MHQTELIPMIAAGLGPAFAFGLVAAKLRMPLLFRVPLTKSRA
jgi:predicted Kef-type K+ transport protein